MSDTLIDELLRQKDLESGRALLSAHASEIDADFLNELGAMGQRAHDEGALAEAATVFSHGVQAADLAGERTLEALFAIGAAQSLHELGHEQAEEVLDFAVERADERVGDGNELVVRGFVAASLRLAAIYDERGEYERSRRLLARTRRRCREIGDVVGELWAVQGLLQACLELRDLRPARGYASILVSGLSEFGVAEQGQVPDRRTVYSLLLQVAHAYYYEEEDFQAAAEVAGEAARVFSGDPNAHVLRANALGQLERFEECVAEYEAAIALPPVEASTYLNYGTALAQLDRLEDAAEAVRQAVELAPDETRYRFVLGQTHAALGRDEEALAEYAETIDQGRRAAEPVPAPTARSRAEYMRNVSGRDIADFAQVARISLLRKLGRADEALADAEALVREGDEGARFGGYLAAGEIHAENGRTDEALAAFTAAAELFDTGEAQLHRADVYAAARRLDDAIRDLAYAAQRDRKPEEALERLDRLVERHQDDGRLLKWRGYAQLESWRPVSAERDLTRALELLGDDPDMYLWRGLARITASPHEGERSFDDPPTHESVTGAVEDLARAATGSRTPAEATAAYTWLVDRLTADDWFFWWIVQGADTPTGFYAIVPAAREPVATLLEAFDLEGQRRWDEAVERYLLAQAGLAAAGLPVSALRVHLRLADNYTRLGELQLALDHLAEVKRTYIGLHTRPLTASLQHAADEQAERVWRRSGGESASVELDYAGVYGIGSLWFLATMRILEAELVARIGEPVRAVELLGDIEELREAGALNVRTIVSVITILRDAGDYERALALVGEAEELARQDPLDYMRLSNTAGTIFQKVGMWDAALDAFEAAAHVAREADLQAPPLIMNTAGTLFHLSQPQKALETLEELDPERDLRTLRDRYQYHALRAQILGALGRGDETIAAVRQAVELADRERSGLRALDLRMTLQSRHATIYELGIDITAAAGDALLAFELVEKSRSRTFVDQLAAGRLPLPPEAEELVAIERHVSKVRRLLLRLNESLIEFGSDFVDYEIVDALEELDDGLRLVEQRDGAARVSPEAVAEAMRRAEASLAEFRARIEDLRRSQAAVTAGEPVSAAEVRSLLRD